MSGRTWTSLRLGVGPSARAPLEYVRRPGLLGDGNRVELLVGGGEAYPAMLAAIAAARSRVQLGTYLVRDDRTGARFRDALVERARAGVRVRVMVDAVGCLGAIGPDWLAGLRSQGVEVLEFHPLAPWRPHWGLNVRNHQKLLVVDGRVGFTGGLNLADEYAPRPQGGGWLDLHVRVEGRAAGELERVFARAWRRGGGAAQRGLPKATHLGPTGHGTRVQTLDNLGLRRRYRMHAAWRFALAAAQRSVLIANAYFVPDLLLRRSFRDAVRRGVPVHVLLPAESDVPIVQYASQHLWRRLLRAGVRLWVASGPMMHAKAAAIDGVWSSIGSYNLDRRSLLHNLEVGLVIADAGFGAHLERRLVELLGEADEVTLGAWERRPRSRRLLERFGYALRYWL